MKLPFNARAGHCSGRYSFGHNSPATAAREMFTVQTLCGFSKSSSSESKKIFFQSGDTTARRNKWG